MRLRALALLLGTLALAACVAAEPEFYPPAAGYGAYPYGPAPLAALPRPGPPAPAGRGRVAILLPLSGPNADRGQGLLKAARLALDAPGAPALDVQDTAGTPDGAARAAQAAVQAGDGLILGPLTAGETAAAAGPARAAGLPMLAFTSDPARAEPGVWTLGLTPGQQVRRLVDAARAQGKTRFAGLLPDNEFGHAMADALTAAAGGPTVRFYSGGMAGMNTAVRDVSDYAERRGPVEEQIRAARARDDAEGQHQAQELGRVPVPPPPFDALLLAEIGSGLGELGSLLPYYDVGPQQVKIMGPALWAAASARAGAAGFLDGAWYAAPDPAARSGFEQGFAAKYGGPPPPLSDLAYDAASLARVAMAQQGGGLVPSLTRPEGFSGADGVFVLGADGHVRRGLAVFEIQHGTPAIVDPAPHSLAPGA
ncbi:MAG: penicillin-binding protein activator [Acidisphaera sp.]|nr:penicillin-binding protein activator [Acidisphaera sp.]